MMDQADKLRKLTMAKSKMRVITVASGKGGVGKTSIVVNLAIELKKAGKNVMVMDADLGMANVDIMLGVIPKFTLYDVFKGNKRLDEVILDGPEGIKLIPGGSGIHELTNITSEQRSRLINDLTYYSNEIDYLLIDSGAGISKSVLGFISAADDVIIVITPEPTSITDAYGIIKVISKFQLNKEVYIIINKAGTLKEAQTTARKIETVAAKYLDISVNRLGFIFEDLVVGKSIREQRPFCYSYPRSRAAKDISVIAQNLLNEKMPAPQGAKNFLLKLLRILK